MRPFLFVCIGHLRLGGWLPSPTVTVTAPKIKTGSKWEEQPTKRNRSNPETFGRGSRHRLSGPVEIGKHFEVLGLRAFKNKFV